MARAGDDWPKLADDLLAPSLQHLPEGGPPGRSPWRVGSQFWVAFLGGPLAVGAIAWLNAGRLGLPASRRHAMLSLAIGALVVLLVGLGWVLATPDSDPGPRAPLRAAVQAAGVLVYLALAGLQRTGDRRHQAFGGDYAPLWGPGLLAILAGALLQAAAAVAVALAMAGARS